MKLSCSSCGTSFDAQRSTRRFCSQACQKRAKRSGAEPAPSGAVESASVRALPRPPADDAEGLTAATERTLRDAQRLSTWQGQAAMELARRIERSLMDTGSAYASLQRELRAAMTLALQGVGQRASALDRHRDELAARRNRGA